MALVKALAESWVGASKERSAMIDRDKITSVLHNRFPAASPQQVAWAANAIVGLGDEWEEVDWNDPDVACPGPHAPSERCYLVDGMCQRTEFRMFKKRSPDVRH